MTENLLRRAMSGSVPMQLTEDRGNGMGAEMMYMYIKRGTVNSFT